MSSEGKDREKRCLREVAGVGAFTVRQLQVVKQTKATYRTRKVAVS